MIVKCVDINDPVWIARREKQWVKVEAWLTDCRFPKKDRKALSDVFFGRIDTFSDPRLSCIDVDDRGFLYLDLNPHQCEKNWEWIIKEGWNEVNPKRKHKNELEVYEQFVRMFTDNYYLSKHEWTLDEKLACFRFLFGEVYDADNFTFMGREMAHPLDPYWVLSQLGQHVNLALLGHQYTDEIWVTLYEFGMAAFKYVDAGIFLPDSKASDETRVMAKVVWYYHFELLYEHKKRYKKYKREGRQAQRFKPFTFEEFIELEEISQLLSRLESDLHSGVIPVELKALKKFSESKSDDMFYRRLEGYTLNPKMTFDELLADRVRPKTVEPKVKRTRVVDPEITIEPAVEKAVCVELETFRNLAQESGMAFCVEPLDCAQVYSEWMKKLNPRYTNAGVMSDFSRLYGLRNKSPRNKLRGYAKILLSPFIGYIQLDVFGECSGDAINREYRTAWKELIKLTGSEVSLKSMRVTKKGDLDDGYDIKVTIVTEKNTHVFDYEMVSDWMDESLLSDANVFAEKENLRWRYQFDHGDVGKSVICLPPAMAELLDW